MDDPLMTAVAVAVATKAVEGVAESGRSALSALVGLVRRRFSGRPAAREALAAAEADPTDATRLDALRDALRQLATEDQQFEVEIRGVWKDLELRQLATGEAVVNSVSGTVAGNVVQARDIHGGISFGGHPGNA